MPTRARLCCAGLVAALCTGLPACAPGGSDDVTPTVVDVVDGDTVVIRMGGDDETARLIGIDTPETKHPTKPVECLGPEAARFTAAVLPAGTAVRLERDVEARDHFGRLLVYLYRAQDGVFVNLELARRGLARPLAVTPNVARRAELDAAAREARDTGRGLWGACEQGRGGPAEPLPSAAWQRSPNVSGTAPTTAS